MNLACQTLAYQDFRRTKRPPLRPIKDSAAHEEVYQTRPPPSNVFWRPGKRSVVFDQKSDDDLYRDWEKNHKG